MINIHEAIRAADAFKRWAQFHLDNPRPEMLEKCRVELIEALTRFDVDGGAVLPRVQG